MNSPLIFRASFRTGITLKGIDGLLEAVGGVLLWFIKPEQLGATLQEIFEHELLARSARYSGAAHLLHTSEKIAQSDPLFASIFLLTHGLVKALLSVLLWMNKLWAYPLAIVVFSARFAVFGIYRYMPHARLALLVIAVFDMLIVLLDLGRVSASRRRRAEAKQTSALRS